MTPSVRPAEIGDAKFIAQMMYESMIPIVGQGMFDDALRDTGVDPIAFNEALLMNQASNWSQLDSFFVLEDDFGRLGGALGAYYSNQRDLRPLTADGFERVSAATAAYDGVPSQTMARSGDHSPVGCRNRRPHYYELECVGRRTSSRGNR